MVSIIISSAKKELLNRVQKNIADSIGVVYEVIAYDNSDGAKGICQIYNQGIRTAKFDLLCFMHEDIAIETNNWGTIVQQIFANNPDIGLIGVAGSSYRPLTPTGWNGVGNEHYYINLVQSFKFLAKEKKTEYHNPSNQHLAPVVCVDGVWFCTTKALAEKYLFDEQKFTGFHVYDLDFSLAIGQEKKVAVTFDVLLNHFSEGNYNESWLGDTIKLYDKWFGSFPIDLEGHSKKQQIFIERKTFKLFLSQLAKNKRSIAIANHFLWKDGKFRDISFGLFAKLQFYVLLAWVKILLGLEVKG